MSRSSCVSKRATAQPPKRQQPQRPPSPPRRRRQRRRPLRPAAPRPRRRRRPADPHTHRTDLGRTSEAATIALHYLGVPYLWGGATPDGFDCSGLVMYVYNQLGISLPHFAAAQYGLGSPVARDQLQPGDLVFFEPPQPRRHLHRRRAGRARTEHRRRGEDLEPVRLGRLVRGRPSHLGGFERIGGAPNPPVVACRDPTDPPG